MKNTIIAFLIFISVPSIAFSDGIIHRSDVVFRYGTGGQVFAAPRAQVWVYIAGTTTLATLYTDSTGSTTVAQPVIADSLGTYSYYVDAGVYDETLVTASGTKTISGVGINLANAAISNLTTSNLISTGTATLNIVSFNTMSGSYINSSSINNSVITNSSIVSTLTASNVTPCGEPYYDLRCTGSITALDSIATATNKGLVCASTYTIATGVTVTVNSPVTLLSGCTLTGSGTISFVKQPSVGADYQVFGSAIAVNMPAGAEIRPEWFGAGTSDDWEIMKRVYGALPSGGTVYTSQTYTLKPVAGDSIPVYSRTRTIASVPGSGFILDWTGKTSLSTYRVFSLPNDGIGGQEWKNLVFDGNVNSIGFNLTNDIVFRFSGWLTGDDNPAMKRYDIVIEGNTFKNDPGGKSADGWTVAGMYESFDFNLGPTGRLKLLHNKRIDCNTTAHVAGQIHNGVDNENYWSTDLIIDDFVTQQSHTLNGQWMGLGTYGVKRALISNVSISGSMRHGLNLEWAEDVTVNGLISNGNGGSPIGTYGYVNRVRINNPILSNSAKYLGGNVLGSHSGTWWKGGIVANPVDIEIWNPTTFGTNTNKPYVYVTSSGTTTGMGAHESVTKNIAVYAKMSELNNILSSAAIYQGAYTSDDVPVMVKLIDAKYESVPFTITNASITSSFTNTLVSLESTTIYQQVRHNVPNGVYAVSARMKVSSGAFDINLTDNTGAAATGASTINVGPTNEWTSVGFVTAITATDPKVSIMSKTTTTADVDVSEFKIARIYQKTQETLVSGTSGTVSFKPVSVKNDSNAQDLRRIIIYSNALNGTAQYTFPTYFTTAPSIISTNTLTAAFVTALTTTYVQVTGVGAPSTGYLFLEGY